MSGRRVLALYGALLLGFAAVVCRLYWLCSNTDYAVRAAAQSEAVLRLPAARSAADGAFGAVAGPLLPG
jgi:hypothetical protein